MEVAVIDFEIEAEEVDFEIEALGSEFTRNLESGKIFITGEKGKGGSAHVATEADNTLRSAAVVKVVEVISEGPIVGICGGARGILINNTPLENADGSFNFPRVGWDYRVGLPEQDYMPGFAAASNEITISAPLVQATPVVRTTTDVSVDAVKLTIQLPQGLNKQNTTNGDLNGSSVDFRIDTKLTTSGTWQIYNSYTISGKTTSAYEAQYRVERPAGVGLWDYRVVRGTVDPMAETKNQTAVARVTEIVDVKLGYEDTAVIGLAIDAESVGSAIPTRAYMVKGLIVSVPTNYTEENLSTGTLGTTGTAYSGVWNGTFKQAWTQCPPWVLYSLMTNTRWGLGEFISENDIDIYSFYDAAVYCDTLVSDGNGGLEPRFTFSAAILTQEDAGKLLQLVAGSFRAKLVELNGKWTLLQDRPSSPVRDITNNDVEDGKFVYKSTGLYERHTAFNVTWNNRADRFLQKISTLEDTLGIARYGYAPIDVAAYGATTEGQAMRQGKWALDTEQNQTENVTFKMSLNGFDLLPNDIFRLFDEDYAAIPGGGRIVSVVGTQVTLDRPVPISGGSTISVTLADGATVEQRSIVESTGELSVVTISAPFSNTVLPDASYIVVSSVSPRQFKILNLKFPSEKVVEVEAVFHDPNKYSRVETGISIPAEVFSNSNAITSTVVLAPSELVFAEDAVLNADNTVTKHILVSWTPATLGSPAVGYYIRYSRNGANSILMNVPHSMVSIPVSSDGEYTINITAYDGAGRTSGTTLSGTYTISSAASGVLGAIVNFYVKGTSGYAWNTDDLTVRWAENGANLTPTQDYLVVVKTAGGVELHREYTPETTYTYTLARHQADSLFLGINPTGTLQVSITPRDLFNRNGTTTIATFINAAPAAVMGLAVFAGTRAATVQWSSGADTDIVGYLLWRGSASTFTPDPSNLVCEGMLNSFTEANLTDSTVYYYKVAAYDRFSRNLYGTGLNISASANGTTSSGSSVNEYQLTGVLFTPNDPTTNSVSWSVGTAYKSMGGTTGTTWAISAGNAAWTSGVLYIYYKEGETILRATTNIITAVASDQTIVATYRGGTNLEVGSGRAYTDGSLLLAGTVAASAIVAGSLTAAQLAATNLSSIFADLGTIVAGNITFDTSGFLKGGQTTYATDTGFYLGNDGAAFKFSVGTGTAGVLTQGISWDGSLFTIAGQVKALSIASSGYIRLGQTAFNTGNGFWMGDVGGASKFSMGEGTGGVLTKGFAYDEATNTLSVEGELIATGNVLNNAITNVVNAYTLGSISTVPNSVAYVELQTVTLTSEGYPIYVHASSNIKLDPMANGINPAVGDLGSIGIKITRDGTTIYEQVVAATINTFYYANNGDGVVAGYLNTTFSQGIVDVPASGSHIYKMYMRNGTLDGDGNPYAKGTAFAASRALVIMEIKK